MSYAGGVWGWGGVTKAGVDGGGRGEEGRVGGGGGLQLKGVQQEGSAWGAAEGKCSTHVAQCSLTMQRHTGGKLMCMIPHHKPNFVRISRLVQCHRQKQHVGGKCGGAAACLSGD